MLKVYDKAQWHIDAGEDASACVARIKAVFEFLNEKNMLTEDGKEMLEVGIDGSISLNEKMVTESANRFLDISYDDVLHVSLENIKGALEERYLSWQGDSK